MALRYCYVGEKAGAALHQPSLKNCTRLRWIRSARHEAKVVLDISGEPPTSPAGGLLEIFRSQPTIPTARWWRRGRAIMTLR